MNSCYSQEKIFAELRYSLRLALPLIASELIYGLSGFITNIMVARIGREALAANALVWSVYITLILFFIGILCAVSVLVAQSSGAKDPAGIKIATNQGLILAIVFAVPMTLILLIAPKILILSGQDPGIIKLAVPYFHTLMWCMLPLNLLIVFEQFLLGIAQTRLVMLLNVVTVPLQILFFYIFIFGKCGSPALGLAGIGYGFALAYGIAAAIIGLYVHYAPQCRNYQIFTHWWQINRKYLFEIIRVGMPMGAMFCIEVALFMAIAMMMGKLGADALAAHQIAFQCYGFAITVLWALSQTTGIRVGYEVGRNNRAAVKLAAYVNMSIGVAWMILLAIFYLGLPKAIIGIDIDIHLAKYAILTQYAVGLLAIAAILQLSDCCRILSVAALRSLKDTTTPMCVSVIGFWCVAFPCAYLFGFIWHFGSQGLWLGMLLGLTVSAVILLLRFRYLVERVDLQQLVTRSN